jgi:hypothetical protein
MKYEVAAISYFLLSPDSRVKYNALPCGIFPSCKDLTLFEHYVVYPNSAFKLVGFLQLISSRVPVLGVVLLLALCSLADALGAGPESKLWLEEARIRVRYRPDGKKEVQQSIHVRSENSPFQGRVEHRLFLSESESISKLNVLTHQGEGNADLEKLGQGLESCVWVSFDSIAGNSVSYELSFEVETDDPSRCPLAVPLADPSDPHSPVRIEIELPQGKVATGMSFPNLHMQEKALTGEMGGIPAFVHVPHGEPSSRAWWSRYGVDLFVLLLMVASIAIWMRYREGLARAAQEGDP